jgi:hypothetical protein
MLTRIYSLIRFSLGLIGVDFITELVWVYGWDVLVLLRFSNFSLFWILITLILFCDLYDITLADGKMSQIISSGIVKI